MENLNISKVLRQLPEGALRWLLQYCMVNGIPTQFEDLKSGQCEYYIYDFKLDIVGGYISLSGNMIYDILNDEPLLQPVKWRNPTQEEVRDIYEGVETFSSLYYCGTTHKIGVFEYLSDELVKHFFQKGKGFALPISWKEEEETPEQKGKRIEEDNIAKLFNVAQDLQQRVIKLEQKEQPVKEFKVGDKVVVFQKLESHDFDIPYYGQITRHINIGLPYLIDDKWWVSADEIQHAPKEVESVDGEYTHFVSLVYKSRNGSKLRSLITSAKDGKDALEKAIEEFKYEVEGMTLEMKTILTLPNKGEIV